MEWASAIQICKETKQNLGSSLNYHLGELFHFGQRAQDFLIKIHGFLPGVVGHGDQPATARSSTLLFSIVSSAVGAATLSLGTGGPWRRTTGLQQTKDQAWVRIVRLLQPHSCAGPGWPQTACRWSSARVLKNMCGIQGGKNKTFRDKLTCLLPMKLDSPSIPSA